MRIILRFLSYSFLVLLIFFSLVTLESQNYSSIFFTREEKSQYTKTENTQNKDDTNIVTSDFDEDKDALEIEEISKEEKTETIQVKRVIDGDTIVLDNNQIVRLIGINTPEKHQRYGAEAATKLREMVEAKDIILEYDKGRYDKYGRLLAYVYTEDLFINYELIEQGFAYLMVIPPNTKYYEVFRKAKEEAKSKKLGIWKK